MTDKTSSPTSTTQIQYRLSDVNGQAVTVNIDQAQAQHLLQQFGQAFGWDIQWHTIAHSHSTLAASISPEDFAQQVLQAAETVAPAGRFGEQQVFINHAWRAWQNSGGQLSLAEFKQHLLEAQQAERLHLGCATLVQTLNAVDVSQSEIISAKGVVYHFVELS